MIYFSFNILDWKYIFGWTIFMTIADFFIIRKIRIYYTNKYNKNWINNKYLKKEFFGKKIYCLVFKKRFYYLCKCITIVLKKAGKI